MDDKIILEKFAKRFSMLIKESNTDISLLAKQIGIKSSSTLYRYMNAQMTPKITTVKYLAEIFNVNFIWLMGYDVPMERKNIVTSNVTPLPDTPMSIPVLGKISAGLPLLAVENIEGYDFAPCSDIKKDYEYFYLIVNGDSMNLVFQDGYRLLVQKQDTLENGEIGVIMVNGYDATVKRFRRENDMIILEPMSSNPEHHVQIYNPKEIEVRIIGKVINFTGRVN